MKNHEAKLPYAWLSFSVTAFFLAFEMALQVSPSVMVPQLIAEFQATPTQLGFISGVYFVTYTLMQVPVGLLFSRFSTKWVVFFALCDCALGALLFGLSHSMWMAGLARLVMGIGSAFGFLSVLVVVTRLFPSRYFAVLAGLTQCLAALGAIFGQSGIAWIVIHFGWRATLIGFSVLALGIALCVACLPNISAEREVKSSPLSGLKTVLSHSITWWIAGYAALLWAPVTVFASLWGVPYLLAVYGFSPVSAASMVSFMFLGVGLASPVVGQFIKWYGNTEAMMRLCALFGLIVSAVLVSAWVHGSVLLIALIFLVGAACAGQVMSFDLVKQFHRPEHYPVALAFNNMGVVISGFICQPLVGFVVHRMTQAGRTLAVAYQYGMFILPLCFLLGYLICQKVLRKRPISLEA